MRNDFCIIVPSMRPELYTQVRSSLAPLEVHWFNGEGFNSFARLINQCILKCFDAKKDILIICADRYRPKPNDIKRVLELLDKGYGLVALGQFGFFGFNLDLIREIGFFDERFSAGGFEDTDMMLRVNEADIALYEAAEIPNEKYNSSWSKGSNADHFAAKWEKRDNTYLRKLKEENYDFDIGPTKHSCFLSWSHSITIYKELKALEFPRPRWNSRIIPTWTYYDLWEKFVILTGYRWRQLRKRRRKDTITQ